MIDEPDALLVLLRRRELGFEPRNGCLRRVRGIGRTACILVMGEKNTVLGKIMRRARNATL
jgi:hypothetical protein